MLRHLKNGDGLVIRFHSVSEEQWDARTSWESYWSLSQHEAKRGVGKLAFADALTEGSAKLKVCILVIAFNSELEVPFLPGRLHYDPARLRSSPCCAGYRLFAKRQPQPAKGSGLSTNLSPRR